MWESKVGQPVSHVALLLHYSFFTCSYYTLLSTSLDLHAVLLTLDHCSLSPTHRWFLTSNDFCRKDQCRTHSLSLQPPCRITSALPTDSISSWTEIKVVSLYIDGFVHHSVITRFQLSPFTSDIRNTQTT